MSALPDPGISPYLRKLRTTSAFSESPCTTNDREAEGTMQRGARNANTIYRKKDVVPDTTGYY